MRKGGVCSGGVPGPSGGCLLSGGVPGPGGVCCRGVSAPKGGVPGPRGLSALRGSASRGCTWSRGVYPVPGVSALGGVGSGRMSALRGVPGQVLPLWTDTRL